jgi:hypothetical protein
MTPFEEEIIRSLRNGSDLPFGAASRLICGREREETIIIKDLQFVAKGGSALRVFLGDYGTGKSMLGRYALEKGLENNMLPIYTSEPPLHKPIEAYQALVKGIITPEFSGESLYYLLSQWSEKMIESMKEKGLKLEELESFLGAIRDKVKEHEYTNDFYEAISAFVEGQITGREDIKKRVIDWMSGQRVSLRELKDIRVVRRVESREESFLFLKDLLKLSQAIDYSGIVVVFDELELTQNLRMDLVIRNYNALREILDMISSKDLPNLYMIWLGTPSWFENGERGVKSYLALHDRLRSELSMTTESTVQYLSSIRPDIFSDLYQQVSSLYRDAYSFDGIAQVDETWKEKLKEFLASPFHQDQFVEMRQVVKSIVEFLDMLKDGIDASKAFELITGKTKEQNSEDPFEFWST